MNPSRLWLLAGLCVVTLWLVPARGQAPAAADVAVQAGRLIDGTSTTVRERATVLIGGGPHHRVQDGWQAPAGARVIDLRTSTVMPGLIDAHTHITGEGTGQRHRAGGDRDAARRCRAIDGLCQAHARGRLHHDPQRRRRGRRGRRAEARDRGGHRARPADVDRARRSSASPAATATRAVCGRTCGRRRPGKTASWTAPTKRARPCATSTSTAPT